MYTFWGLLDTPIFLIVASTLVLISFSVRMSSINTQEIRAVLLLALTVAVLAIGFHSYELFEPISYYDIYESFFINIGTELLAALIIAPAIFGLWKATNSLIPSFVAALLLMVASVVVVQQYRLIAHLLNIPLDLSRMFTLNFGIEFISTIVVFLVLMMLMCSYHILMTAATGLRGFTVGVLVLLIMILMILLLVFLTFAISQIDPRLVHQVVLGVLGAVLTSIFIRGEFTSSILFLLLVCTLVLLAVTGLIVAINDFGSNFSISLSAELIGALVASVLLEGGMFAKGSFETILDNQR